MVHLVLDFSTYSRALDNSARTGSRHLRCAAPSRVTPLIAQTNCCHCYLDYGPERETRRTNAHFPTINPASARRKEKLQKVRAPSLNGLRPNHSRRIAVVSVAHLQRIPIGEIRRDLAVIAHRNIRAFFAKLNAIPVVWKEMRLQTRSNFLAARHCGK